MEFLKGRWGRWGDAGLARRSSRAFRASVGGWAILVAVVSGSSRALVLSVDGRANATPSIAADGDRVAIAWSASTPSGATDIYLATSRDAGDTFSTPVRVNDVEGDARVSGEQPPRVAVSGASVTVVWTARGDRGTDLRFARSTDGGRTFGASKQVPGSIAAGNRGWEAVASNVVIWLDHRELASDGSMAAMHHEHAADKPDGVAVAQKSKLMIASLDGTPRARAITGGVCYCCKTALATANGLIAAAWRHVYPGNLRDIAFALSRDGGRTFEPPVRVSEDKWQLEGCPDDGPAMAMDASRRIHIVWPTLVTGTGEPTIALFYSASSDGVRFTPRQRIPTEGLPHHPQLAVGGDGALTIAWDELGGGSRRAVMARGTVDPDGRLQAARRVVDDREAAYYPVVAATRRGTVAAWTSGRASASVIRVLTEK